MNENAAVRRAVVLYDQGRYPQAIEELQRALAGDPQNARAHVLLSLCHTGAGSFEAAMAWARSAIRAAPDDPDGSYAWAWSVARNPGRERPLSAAAPALREALRLARGAADLL